MRSESFSLEKALKAYPAFSFIDLRLSAEECYSLLLPVLKDSSAIEYPRVSTQCEVALHSEVAVVSDRVSLAFRLGSPNFLVPWTASADAARKSVDAVSPTQNPAVSHDDTSRISPNVKHFVKEKYHQLNQGRAKTAEARQERMCRNPDPYSCRFPV